MMIAMSAVLARVQGVDAATLEVWIAQDWVRPRRRAGAPVFDEIDIARLRLIIELRDQMEVADPTIPVVLSLLDQLHGARADLRRLLSALDAAGDQPAREVLRGVLGGGTGTVSPPS